MSDMAKLRAGMVDCQVRPSDVTRYAIIEAMLWAPRERFVPERHRAVAYAGAEIALSPDRALLEPRTLAKMLEALGVAPGERVLDLAPGTGYSTALLARMGARVVAVEPDAALAGAATSLLGDLAPGAQVFAGDATVGAPDLAPFDAILINGAIEWLPTALTDQLAPGGRLVALWRDGVVGQARLTRATPAGVAHRPVFDATGPLVPGFVTAPVFSF